MRYALSLVALAVAAAAIGATVPAGFTDTAVVSSGLSAPTAMAIAPDGRIFVCQQGGSLRVIKNGALLSTPFISLTVDSNGERGLLGVAFDPDFLSNHFIYLYYTATTPAIHNRISRFTANGDVVTSASEFVLLDLPNLSAATNHNGGAIHFGGDGKLYADVGENANGANSQSMSTILGKTLRINKDGTIPTDNPFYGSATGDNRLIWALGLRNPFTFAIHPNTGRIFINDVGESTWEEINEGTAGANYGWNLAEGPSANPAFTNPVHYYGHGPACAIAGGTFYAPEMRQFPAAYVESYFFSDLCAGWIHRLDQATGPGAVDFATGTSSPVDMLVGHDGSLYYLARAPGGGVVSRIRWTASLDGDVNNDGTTSTPDLFYFINYFYGGGGAPSHGDVDGSGQINTNDLTYLVQYVLGRGPTPM